PGSESVTSAPQERRTSPRHAFATSGSNPVVATVGLVPRAAFVADLSSGGAGRLPPPPPPRGGIVPLCPGTPPRPPPPPAPSLAARAGPRGLQPGRFRRVVPDRPRLPGRRRLRPLPRAARRHGGVLAISNPQSRQPEQLDRPARPALGSQVSQHLADHRGELE